MQEDDLSRLTRELQKETCPPRVHDEVTRKISAETSSRGWLRLAIPVLAAIVIAVCCISVWRTHEQGKARQEAALAQQAARVQIANQAGDALGLIGSVLANAATDSGKIISEQAVPPLRNGLQTANNKIIHNIRL